MKNPKPQVRIVRQGDVLIRSTDRQPSATAKSITDQGRVILAYGEVTGHAHQVVTADPAIVLDPDDVPAQQLFEEPDGSRLLVVRRDAELRHEEHGRIALAPGNYEVVRQMEYTPQQLRQVAD